MFWFAVGCTLGGVTIGLLAPSLLVLALTSFQVIAILSGLWASDVISGLELVMWSVTGIFLHQGAYLGGVMSRAMRKEEIAPSISEQVDGDLFAMDGLVGRIETDTPVAQVHTDELKTLIQQMRLTLRDGDALERLRRERKRALS